MSEGEMYLRGLCLPVLSGRCRLVICCRAISSAAFEVGEPSFQRAAVATHFVGARSRRVCSLNRASLVSWVFSSVRELALIVRSSANPSSSYVIIVVVSSGVVQCGR